MCPVVATAEGKTRRLEARLRDDKPVLQTACNLQRPTVDTCLPSVYCVPGAVPDAEDTELITPDKSLCPPGAHSWLRAPGKRDHRTSGQASSVAALLCIMQSIHPSNRPLLSSHALQGVCGALLCPVRPARPEPGSSCLLVHSPALGGCRAHPREMSADSMNQHKKI